MKIFNQNKFSNDIIFLRKCKEMSQEDLANALETTKLTISNLEKGAQFPSLELLERFCDYSNMVPEDYFISKGANPVLAKHDMLSNQDIEQIKDTIESIMIHEKYHALHKRCCQ